MQNNNDNTLQEKLFPLKGKPLMYRGRNLVITGWRPTDEGIEILTNGQSIFTSFEKLDARIAEFLPVEGSVVNTEAEHGSKELPDTGDKTGTSDSNIQVFAPTSNNLSSLENILMDNITKLKDDRKYLSQAREINNHANSIINIAKTKVAMVREIRMANNQK